MSINPEGSITQNLNILTMLQFETIINLEGYIIVAVHTENSSKF